MKVFASVLIAIILLTPSITRASVEDDIRAIKLQIIELLLAQIEVLKVQLAELQDTKETRQEAKQYSFGSRETTEVGEMKPVIDVQFEDIVWRDWPAKNGIVNGNFSKGRLYIYRPDGSEMASSGYTSPPLVAENVEFEPGDYTWKVVVEFLGRSYEETGEFTVD